MAYGNESGMVGASMVLEVLAILGVILRFTSRKIRGQALLADDWLMIPSIVFATALACIDIFAFVNLPGTITPEMASRVKTIEQAQFSMYVITAVAMCFIKCSITCLYRRIFVSRVFALVCNVFIAIVIVWAIAVTLGIIFGCGKRFGQIFPPPGESSCRSYYHAGIVAFSTDIVLDVVLVVLPLPMVWRLQMSWKKRVAIGSIFLVGLFAVGASVGRMVTWIQDTGANNVGVESTTEASIWNLVTVHTSLVVACLPTIGPLFSTFKSSNTGKRLRSKLSTKFPMLRIHDDQMSQLSAATRKQRSNPLLSSAHASDPEIGAVPSDTEMQPNDVYVRRDMVVEEEQIPHAHFSTDNWV